MLHYKMNGEVADSFSDRVMSFHQPELSQIDGGLVYSLFSDGEIDIQKCSDLLWQRNLHLLDFGYEELGQAWINIPKDEWPDTYNGYGFIFCTEEQARMLREEMANV